MRPRLVGNIVKTDVADYPCATREEAEALFMSLSQPHRTEEVREEPGREARQAPQRPRGRQ